MVNTGLKVLVCGKVVNGLLFIGMVSDFEPDKEVLVPNLVIDGIRLVVCVCTRRSAGE